MTKSKPHGLSIILIGVVANIFLLSGKTQGETQVAPHLCCEPKCLLCFLRVVLKERQNNQAMASCPAR